mmetsp:Transcript_11850/g.35435  ORF Transcript_11850/g.35435 Transcript_11850/m.35435 type:complete len:241 (+) Transcript_11850:410-1132(+)
MGHKLKQDSCCALPADVARWRHPPRALRTMATLGVLQLPCHRGSTWAEWQRRRAATASVVREEGLQVHTAHKAEAVEEGVHPAGARPRAPDVVGADEGLGVPHVVGPDVVVHARDVVAGHAHVRAAAAVDAPLEVVEYLDLHGRPSIIVEEVDHPVLHPRLGGKAEALEVVHVGVHDGHLLGNVVAILDLEHPQARCLTYASRERLHLGRVFAPLAADDRALYHLPCAVVLEEIVDDADA